MKIYMAEFKAFGGPVLKIYFFIGRLNPPHMRHIHALAQMIQEANADGSTPLILLGNGPGGERTLDNPIPFETKQTFLRHILPGLTFELRSMKNAYQDVPQWYTDVVSHLKGPPESVEFIQFAGDKGENASKFDRLYEALEKLGANIKAGSRPIPPMASNNGGTEMSATIVRQHAYRCFVEDRGTNGFKAFESRFAGFYGEFTGQMYKDICFPAIELSDEDIMTYVETKKLPKGKSKSKKKP